MIITSNTSAAERGRRGEVRKEGRRAGGRAGGQGRDKTGAAERMKKHKGETRGARQPAGSTAGLPEQQESCTRPLTTAAKVCKVLAVDSHSKSGQFKKDFFLFF